MDDTTPERWLPVVGYEGLYEVSDQGRVRRVPSVLKLTPDGAGRLQVGLSKNGVSKTRRVHHLVAEAFIGPRPEGLETRHLDDNSGNNQVSNLAYGTTAENRQDMLRNGGHYWANQTHCKNGHEFTPENTYLRPARGENRAYSRVCRTCVRDRVQEHLARTAGSGPRCRNGCEAPARACGLCAPCYAKEWAAARRSDELLEKVCPQCGGTFQFLPGKGSGNRKYCTEECFKKARNAQQRERERKKRAKKG